MSGHFEEFFTTSSTTPIIPSRTHMPLCSVCIDDLKAPVCLPCGHVFCHECIVRAVNTIKPYSTVHHCPSCRAQYSVVNIDPNLVPSHLRPHVIPSVRRIYIDESTPIIDTNMNRDDALSQCARVTSENAVLRMNCSLWRKRAEVHAAATLGLLGLARSARDYALKVKHEKEELEQQVTTLKRKLDDRSVQFSPDSPLSPVSSASTSRPSSPRILTSAFPSIAIPHNHASAIEAKTSALHTLNSVRFSSCPSHLGWMQGDEILSLDEHHSKRRRLSSPSPSEKSTNSVFNRRSTKV